MKNAFYKKGKSFAGLKRLFTYLKNYKLMLCGVLIALLITSASILMISQSIKHFIDNGISTSNPSSMDTSLFLLLITVLVLAIFTCARFILITWTGELLISDLRKEMYAHILKLPLSFFEKKRSGDIISSMTSDTTLLLSLIGTSLSFTLRNAIMLIGGLIMMLATNITLSLMIMLIIPAVIFPLIFLGKKLKDLSRKSQDLIADLTSQSDQTIQYLKTIQSYCREGFEMSQYTQKLNEHMHSAFMRILMRGVVTAMVILLALGGIALVLWFGGHQVIEGKISAGDLSAFVYISIVCSASVAALSDVFGDLYKMSSSADRIFEFLDTEVQTEQSTDKFDKWSSEGKDITFKNLSFKYDASSDKNTINNINLSIKAGNITALVGKSGAGKSTIFMLIEKFYTPNSGGIYIGKDNIQAIPTSILRKNLTYISQDVHIFASSIFDNIAYGNPNASKEDVYNAANLACCTEFIEKMPQGFDTYLGEKGIKLSGGQKQRIAIARAILNDPKVLLLDEATSSLDSENERFVQIALTNLMQGRTTIVIAHRLGTIINADSIVVLDAGSIIAQGKHSELVQDEESLYFKLYSSSGIAEAHQS